MSKGVDVSAFDGTDDGQDHYVQIVVQDATSSNLMLSRPQQSQIKKNRTLHDAPVGSRLSALHSKDGKWVIYQSDEGDHTQVKFERLDAEYKDVDTRGLVMGVG